MAPVWKGFKGESCEGQGGEGQRDFRVESKAEMPGDNRESDPLGTMSKTEGTQKSLQNNKVPTQAKDP